MTWHVAAVVTLTLHLAFIAFVVFGALAVWRWRRLVWLHIPAAAWGTWIELSGATCPLTYLENALRERAGLAGYRDGFVAHYLLATIYPAGLTRHIQYALAAMVLVVNLLVYSRLARSRRVGASRACRSEDRGGRRSEPAIRCRD
ncbi:MAG: DUF2784 domain-containing protein [Proteobacteria bacterium]|nr:DUF2784 domain-containing protein [Pseudomonadota bacterium]